MSLPEFLLLSIATLCLLGQQINAFSPASFKPHSVNRNSYDQKSRITYSSGAFDRQFRLSSSASNSIKSNSYNIENNDLSSAQNQKLEMPWNDWQVWALRDNISKYRISFAGSDYVLWRTMVREVTELAGYEVEFVREMYSRYISSQDNPQSPAKKGALPRILPLLDQFEFESMGGITGKVYGLNGIAEGATIQTPELVNMENTVPRGYIICGSVDGDCSSNVVAYELGQPIGQSLDLFNNDERYQMLSTLVTAAASTVSNTKLLENGAKKTRDVVAGIDNDAGSSSTVDMMVNMGGVTAILLTSAAVLNAFHHHLTVNVFWV